MSEPRIRTTNGLQGDLTETIIASVTLEKLEYLFRSSMPYNVAVMGNDGSARNIGNVDCSDVYCKPRCTWCSPEDGTCICVKNLARESLRRYHRDIVYDETHGDVLAKSLYPTDLYPGDDRLLIAAMCLVKSSLQEQQGREFIGTTDHAWRLLQAAAILELGANRSKANAHFSLLLVRLYSKLGAGNLALRAYLRLNLKGIQKDTVSYVLFDRMSQLHPHPIVDDQLLVEVDPVDELKKIQTVYRKSEDQISANIWLSFEYGSYDTALQIIEVDQRLAKSMGKALTDLELRRIRRMTNSMKVPEGYHLHFPVQRMSFVVAFEVILMWRQIMHQWSILTTQTTSAFQTSNLSETRHLSNYFKK